MELGPEALWATDKSLHFFQRVMGSHSNVLGRGIKT